MDVTVIPLTEFVHGRISARTGQAIRVSAPLAGDLERAGLIRIPFVRQPAPIAPIVIRNGQGGAIELYGGARGKAADDGQGQPSSASPVAPASPMQTLPPSSPGASKTAKTTK